jgi:hypothetical protein
MNPGRRGSAAHVQGGPRQGARNTPPGEVLWFPVSTQEPPIVWAQESYRVNSLYP